MPPRTAKVTITYCAECGYEPMTLALAGALMNAFTHRLSAIELIPWYEGSFEVSVGGKLVHSMYRDGGFPEHQTIIDAVTAHLAGRDVPPPSQPE
ncbi:MAG: Rdx family protein [Chloroflexi bacterium]|nr:Rdx family protein [Chloroflexota bacterium]